jgi:hypothetical protein
LRPSIKVIKIKRCHLMAGSTEPPVQAEGKGYGWGDDEG